MKSLLILLFLCFFVGSVFGQKIKSPDGRFALDFKLDEAGTPVYELSFKDKTVIKESRLGIEVANQPNLTKDFRIVKTETSEKDETWRPVWGEVREIRNNYRELAVTLEQNLGMMPRRTVILRFRLFNDGLGFRYEFPAQNDLKYFTVKEEKTEFNLTGDHKAFWIPGDYDTNEYAYSTTRLSEIHALPISQKAIEIGTRAPFADNAVQTPLMLKSAENLYINIHEAALIDYPAMQLVINRQTFNLTTHLAPNAVGSKALLQTPAQTPWRTIIAGDKAADILAAKIVLNLNEPSKIVDTSWIKPQKFVGVWWEMHVNKATWNYADAGNIKLAETDWKSLKPNGKHGATTANVKRYIDFAAKNNIDAVLVEGWNVGWEDWYGNWKEEVFDFLTPYPDFDVAELKKYAAGKNVKLVMHHETSSSVTNYERRLDEAFRFMKANGYDAVKTGYVGRIIPRGEWHDGQWMVNHYNRVAEKAAKYQIMIDAHEPVRPTGLHRTYPNWMTSEAARGNEFNAWSVGNPPEHETILPFTRLVGGPMDYTPGIFQIKLDAYQAGKKEQVHTTLAKQLALYVTMYSPLQMAADLPENYEKHPDAFQFIRDVAVDWDDTRILEAEPGDFVTIARKAKNRDEWFVGAITDENARTATVALDFLAPNRTFLATVYGDDANAHWQRNPQAYKIENFLVDGKTVLKIALAEGGGAAISLRAATKDDSQKYKNYR
ncbi:MAG: glycoside hydrolase family 97 protein [Acidobacteriota bacterium]|nr:glycoside hydrolase family 97 protein [Acidobacteriota bacterium]